MHIGMSYLDFGGSGGIERAMFELSKRLVQRGNAVDFVCLRDNAGNANTSVRVRQVRSFTNVFSEQLVTYGIKAGIMLRKVEYDITHSSGNVIGTDVITAHSCHRAGLQLQENNPAMKMGRRNFGIADRVRLFIERENYARRRYKKVIAVSHGVKRELSEFYGVPENDVVVIPNGVDLEQFNPSVRNIHRTAIRARLGIQPDEFVMIFVANEFERKGLVHILDSLVRLKNRGVTLLVMGRDRVERYSDYVRSLGLTHHVRFLGAVKRIEEYYAAADVFILPTLYEAFSLATIEASAAGLPLLVTEVNGTEELVSDGFNGFFIGRGGHAIAERVEFLLQHPGLVAHMGGNARTRSEEYGWDTVTKRTLLVYEEVLR